MKKYLFGMPIVALVVIVSLFFSCGNKGNTKPDQTTTDSVAVESTETDPTAAKGFLENMYKDFFEPWNNQRENEAYLSKYFTKQAMDKFYVESDYNEGEYFYCTDFLIHGLIAGGDTPDYGDKIVSRTIEPNDDGWFLVTNIWNAIKDPIKVRLKVKLVDGVYKVVDIGIEEKSVNDTSSDKNIVKISDLRNGGAFKDVLSSIGYSNKSIENERGYTTDYWFKNCELDNHMDVVKPINKYACVVEVFDGMSASVRITVFDEYLFDDLKKQTLQYCKKDRSGGYLFDWGDGEDIERSVNMGKSDFRKGGYYIDIPF